MVKFVQQGDLNCIQVCHPLGQAVVALQGAQVLQYAPVGAEPVIWLSERVEYKSGQALRGGVPVCWPWFGDLSRNPDQIREQYDLTSAPAHGWARTALWELVRVDESARRVTLVLQVSENSLANAPTNIGVIPSLEIGVGAALTLKLGNRNASTKPAMLSQALHTYLAVSDINNVEIAGLEGVPYIDTVGQWHEMRSNNPIRLSAETDRIYQGDVAHVQLQDSGWNRTLHIKTQHSRSLVLWNPHIEKSMRLNQFAPDAWRRMVCIESANVAKDMLMLLPGESCWLETEITMQPNASV